MTSMIAVSDAQTFNKLSDGVELRRNQLQITPHIDFCSNAGQTHELQHSGAFCPQYV